MLFHFPNERFFLLNPCLFADAFDENQACFVQLSGKVKFMFGGRNTFLIFVAVEVSNQAQIDVTFLNLSEIHFLWTVVVGRDFLEDERLEELAQQHIRTNVIGEHGSFG